MCYKASFGVVWDFCVRAEDFFVMQKKRFDRPTMRLSALPFVCFFILFNQHPNENLQSYDYSESIS